MLEGLLERLHKGEKLTTDRRLLRATAKDYTEALRRGYGNALTDINWNSPDFATLEHLTENVYQFAAAKNWHELRDLADAVRDGDKIRSFEEFREVAHGIVGKYNQNWLRTEYNQVIAAAQAGARWNDYNRNASKMPYLQYQCVMDGNTRADHAALHGIIKRIDDPFWDKYMPPNGWGCRCEAIQLPGSAYKETPDTDIHPPVVSPMFQINFGKQGLAFPVSHAYFKEMPSNVWRHLEPSVRSEVLIYYKDLARQTMPTMGAELTECANLQTGKLKRNANARDSVLDGKHARTVEEVKAVRYAWNNPDKLQFEKVSPMGEHKDMTNEAHIRNLSNKAKRRVVEYLQYSFDYKGQTYHIKLERLSDGFEQFYSLTKP